MLSVNYLRLILSKTEMYGQVSVETPTLSFIEITSVVLLV